MFCKNCGKEVDEDVKFCPYCGANLGENEPKKEKVIIVQDKHHRSPIKTGAIMNLVFAIFFGIIITFLLIQSINKEVPEEDAKGISTSMEIVLAIIVIIACIIVIIIAISMLTGKIKSSNMVIISIVATVISVVLPAYDEWAKTGDQPGCVIMLSILPVIGIIGSIIALVGIRDEKDNNDML